MPTRLYVGNLPKELERQELEAVFAEAGDSVSTKVITDRKTGKCRGFGFVTVKDDEQADEIIEKYNGYVLRDTPIKIEKALPRAKGKGDEESGDEGNPETVAIAAPIRRSSKSAKKGKKPSGSGSGNGGTPTSEANQPDPRWAQELGKLKELLAAQAVNP